MATFPDTGEQITRLARAARHAWEALEPLHNLLYFVPVAEKRFAEAGIHDRMACYFAARASVLGVVPADVVVATFYNFNPQMVRSTMPRIWERATPEALIAARFDVADLAVRPLLGDAVGSPELAEALTLARRAAESASGHLLGRPLFAAHAALDWPDLPHVQLWWAQTLLREFRGDGHQATLMAAGVGGPEALVLYVATEKVDGEALRLTRGWGSGPWKDTIVSLREQGLLTEGPEIEVTARGRALRQWVEDRTDLLAQPAYEVLGVEGSERLAELSRRLNEPVIKADVIPWLKKRVAVSRRSKVRPMARAPR
jgi:hypothetical protein